MTFYTLIQILQAACLASGASSFNPHSIPPRQILLHSQNLEFKGSSPIYTAVILVMSILGG